MRKRNGISCSEAGKLGYIAAKEVIAANVEKRKNDYYKNPSLCLECECILPYESRHNKFCSQSCSATYNNKHRSKEVKERIAKSIKETCNKNKIIHKKYCKYCGCEKGKCQYPEICSKYRIFKSLEKFGFDKNAIGTKKVYGEFFKAKKVLEDMYKLHLTDEQLKVQYNYVSGLSNFHKLLKSLNIQTRTLSEALKESLLMGKREATSMISKQKTEWHTTWDGKEVFLRSSYEIDYANFLDEKKVKYEVENLRIKYFDTQKKEYRCAIPDFYIEKENEIIEIKSVWTLNVQNMKDKFYEYIRLGYKPKLILEHKETNIFEL